jgi:hypothetical protein
MKVKAPFDALALMRKLGLVWRPGGPPLALRRAGGRVPRAKFAHGPRVNGGNRPRGDLTRRADR